MVETIYIARHGSRMDWISKGWKSETGLPRDSPLAPQGVTEAKELAAHFLSLPPEKRPTAMFSSPFYRCLQTAQPTAEALGIPIYVDHGLSERYLPVVPGTGLHPRPGTATSLKQYFPQIDPSWNSTYYPSRKGEALADIYHRAASFLGVLVPEMDGHLTGGDGDSNGTQGALARSKHKHILLVTHAAVVVALARELLGDRDLPLRVGCCSLTAVERKSGDQVEVALGGWKESKLGDGSHLSVGPNTESGLTEDVSLKRMAEGTGQPDLEGDLDEPVGLQVYAPIPCSFAAPVLLVQRM